MKIIFIPGLICTQEIWGDLNQLRNRYECLDADVTLHDNIEEMADVIAQKISAINHVAVIGISMGGYVTIDLALRNLPNIKKIILISTTAHAVEPNTIDDRLKAIEFAKKNRLKDLVQASANFCLFEQRLEWSVLQEKMAGELGPNVYIKQQKAIMSRKNRMDELPQIDCQTLIIAGKEDKIIPYQDALTMFSKIPQAQLVLFNQCGHLPTWEKGNMLVGYIEKFLQN